MEDIASIIKNKPRARKQPNQHTRETTPEEHGVVLQTLEVMVTGDAQAGEPAAMEFMPEQGKRKPGRPTKLTREVLKKLEYAFKLGCTDREAALHAGIHARTLWTYFAKHPEYRQLTEAWKDDYLVIFSRANVAASILGLAPKGSVAVSQDYLRAKRKDEFAEKNITELQAALTPAEIEERATREFQGKRQVIEGEAVAQSGHSPTLSPTDKDEDD